VFPIWSDGRKGNGDLDIYVAKIHLYNPTSIPDLTTIRPEFALRTIYPNPANDKISIDYELNSPTDVELMIYNSESKLVKTIRKSNKLTGLHHNEVNTNSFKSGIYYLLLDTDYGYSIKKFIIAR